ncbi:MAG TPA: hypothetical protein VM260_22035 [Pirellula sp.]|nr:hypothetical protein [Pirellula sp.]
MSTKYDLWIRDNGAWKLAIGNMRGKRALEELGAYGLIHVNSLRPTLVPCHWSQWLEYRKPSKTEVAAVARDEDDEVVTVLSGDGKRLLRRFFLLAVDLVESDVLNDGVSLGIFAAHLEAIAGDLGQKEGYTYGHHGDTVDAEVCSALHVSDEEYWKRTLSNGSVWLERHLWSTEWLSEGRDHSPKTAGDSDSRSDALSAIEACDGAVERLISEIPKEDENTLSKLGPFLHELRSAFKAIAVHVEASK